LSLLRLIFDIAYMYTEFEGSSFTRSRYDWGKEIKIGHVTMTTSIWGLLVIPKLKLEIAYLLYKVYPAKSA